ncbi:TIGR01906 family membrane protein [Clostridium polynesiense]|uniref:TIGR01906 family membrane protein n=1 Tax=Clostridium polynesiense TaxID=1325933 RepID=UPI00069455F7|nr:TIGR01906 family membrane protein [Clostridium polynesiense]
MNNINPMGKRNKINPKLFTSILLGILLSLFTLTFTIKFTLNFTPLYSWEVTNLNLDKNLSMDKNTLVKNYKAVTSYIENPRINKLIIPDFKMSKEGEIHFKEVKEIFNLVDMLFYTSLLLFFLIYIYAKKKNKLSSGFLNIASWLLILLPAGLFIPFIINFNKSFVIFHKLFFSNDYWIFDPDLDPIINALPEEYFFHSASLILILLVVFFITFKTSYIMFNKKNR